MMPSAVVSGDQTLDECSLTNVVPVAYFNNEGARSTKPKASIGPQDRARSALLVFLHTWSRSGSKPSIHFLNLLRPW